MCDGFIHCAIILHTSPMSSCVIKINEEFLFVNPFNANPFNNKSLSFTL